MNICEQCDTINPDTATHCSCSTELSSDAIGVEYLAAAPERPAWVTALCWLTIIWGTVTLFRMPSYFADPNAYQIAHLLYMDLALISIGIIGALGMLAGQAWARTLTVLTRTVGLFGAFIIAPLGGVISLIFFVIILSILYSDKANAYFAPRLHPV